MRPARPIGRRNRFAAVLGLAAAALGLLVSCDDGEPIPFDDVACEKLLKAPGAVDASEWLRTPPGPNMLGAMTTEEGLAFASKLDARGAKRVVAVGIRRVT